MSSNDDWRVGDLAECVNTGDIRFRYGDVALGGRYLKKGMIYLVSWVDDDGVRLCLDVGASHGHKLAMRFRKVPPLVGVVIAAEYAERPHPARVATPRCPSPQRERVKA